MSIPKIAAVNDLSGFGRCSLTVALPVLSAMGLQVCPLPTALLSNHTGFPRFTFDDRTDQLPADIDCWRQLGLRFDAVYTGFLGSEAQVDTVTAFLSEFTCPGGLKLVDPVMGDHGKPYATFSPSFCRAMRRLIAAGDIITPNLTEACLLTDEDYGALLRCPDEADFLARVYALGERTVALGSARVVITGVSRQGEAVVRNVIVESGSCQHTVHPMVPVRYAGTGDLFASVLCGCLMRGTPLQDAVEYAANFVSRTVADTADSGNPPLHGVEFEPLLPTLFPQSDTVLREERL